MVRAREGAWQPFLFVLVLLGHVLSLLCFTNTRFSLLPMLLFTAAYHHLQAMARGSLRSGGRLALDPRTELTDLSRTITTQYWILCSG